MALIEIVGIPICTPPPHPNQVTMRDEMKNQLNEKEAGPSLMVVYRFEPRKHNVDPKIFDSMRRAIRGGDRDFLRTAVGDQTDSRKSNTQKRVEAQKRRELRVKPMKKTNASYITVNRRNKPWYVKKDRTNIPIPWSNQEDKILMSAVARFGFNWSIVEKRLCGAGDHPRHLRGKKECFLRYVELRDRAKMDGSNHKFFLDSEFSEIPKPPPLEFEDEVKDENIIRRQYPQSASFRRTNRRVYRSILESSGLFQKPWILFWNATQRIIIWTFRKNILHIKRQVECQVRIERCQECESVHDHRCQK